MTVTFYLEAVNGERHAWTNYTVTRKDEIEWLLKNVKETLEKMLEMKDTSSIPNSLKPMDNGGGMGYPINKRF